MAQKIIDNLSIIACYGYNYEIGKDNDLIFKISEDLKFFKEQTMGKPMVMGYNTFMSLKNGKPLPGREHIILTNSHADDFKNTEHVIALKSLDDILDYIKNIKSEVMIIGGASVYKQLIEYTKVMYLTEVNQIDMTATAHFPKFDKKEWETKVIYKSDDLDEIQYQRLIYTRK